MIATIIVAIVVSVLTSITTATLMEAYFVRRAQDEAGEFDEPDYEPTHRM